MMGGGGGWLSCVERSGRPPVIAMCMHHHWQVLGSGIHRFPFGFFLPATDVPPTITIPQHIGHSPNGNGQGSLGSFSLT